MWLGEDEGLPCEAKETTLRILWGNVEIFRGMD